MRCQGEYEPRISYCENAIEKRKVGGRGSGRGGGGERIQG